MKRILEIACFDLPSVKVAQSSGADRIEFCNDYYSGGITPIRTDILLARENCQLPLHVIIRPRKGDFCYSLGEMKKMEEDILFCKAEGINGIVIGALTRRGSLDATMTKELVSLADGMSVTFHRAIDQSGEYDNTIYQLIQLGVSRVLLSGGILGAKEGVAEITRLQEKYGDKIRLMPGGGIRSDNLTELVEKSHCQEFHSAALDASTGKISEMEVIKMKTILSSYV